MPVACEGFGLEGPLSAPFAAQTRTALRCARLTEDLRQAQRTFDGSFGTLASGRERAHSQRNHLKSGTLVSAACSTRVERRGGTLPLPIRADSHPEGRTERWAADMNVPTTICMHTRPAGDEGRKVDWSSGAPLGHPDEARKQKSTTRPKDASLSQTGVAGLPSYECWK